MGALKSKHANSLDFSKVSVIIKELLKLMINIKEYLDEIKLRLKKFLKLLVKSVKLKKEEKNL